MCAILKTYGKTPEELRIMVDGFCWALIGYEMPKIIDALRQHVIRSREIPYPLDILEIMDPSIRPKEKLSVALYVEIKKRLRQDVFVTREEKKYCEAFETQEMGKAGLESVELRQARAEIESQTKALAWEGE